MSMQGLKLGLAPLAWGLLRGSIRVNHYPGTTGAGPGPYIFACLHRDMLPAIIFVQPARPYLLISNSLDGDILVRTLGRKNYGFVRGATGVDGSRALVALRKELAQGHSIGLAVDGPKGPFGKIHAGVLKLASLSQAPIIPLVAKASRATNLHTWDQTLVPLPFSRVQVEMGRHLHVPLDFNSSNQAAVAKELESFFFGQEGRPA